MRWIYTALLYLASPFAWAALWLKSRRDAAYRRQRGERFGHVPKAPGGVAVWVHAISVGEVLAALPLIRALLATHGEGRVWVSCGTPTGRERIRAALGERVHHSYAPFDLPHAVARFLDRVRPTRVVIMETELWPNLYATLARRGIPLLIANARLSPRSLRGYGRVGGFARSVLGCVSLVAAQSEADAERFRALGAPHVAVLGNLKFDAEPDAAQLADGRRWREAWGEGPVWVAASTHEGEEAAALGVHAALRARWPSARLVLVPRHPQRFEAVARAIEAAGLPYRRRSHAEAPTGDFAVLLGDTLGEMWRYLATADLAFVGGSLVPIGGHNVLEPAALGLPVLFGPHMHNFEPSRAALLEADGAIEVADASALAAAVTRLLEDPAERHRRGAAAAAALAAHRGALARHLAAIAALPTAA